MTHDLHYSRLIVYPMAPIWNQEHRILLLDRILLLEHILSMANQLGPPPLGHPQVHLL